MGKTAIFSRKISGGVYAIEDQSLSTGDRWFVDSGQTTTGADAAGYGTSPDQPFLTLAYAFSGNNPTANNGDIIYVMPGHAESITAAAGIAQDIEGVTVEGIGVGADRPEITFASSDNSATYTVTAANSVIKNVVGICGDDGLTSAFVVSAADCAIDIEWQDGSSAIEASTVITSTAAANNLDIKLRYIGFTAGNACVSPIILTGNDGIRVDIDFYGKASTAVVEFKTTAVIDTNVTGYMYNSGTTDFSKSVVDTVGGSTWFADFFDGAAGGRASGGSGGALASDDITLVSSKVDSVGTQVSTVDSEVSVIDTEIGVIASKQDSQVTLQSTQYSTLVSKIDSNS